MTKTDLVDEIRNNGNLTKKESESFLNTVLEVLMASLERGEDIRLDKFGTFSLAKRAARIGRHPKTKEPLELPPSCSVSFKPAKAFKERLKKMA